MRNSGLARGKPGLKLRMQIGGRQVCEVWRRDMDSCVCGVWHGGIYKHTSTPPALAICPVQCIILRDTALALAPLTCVRVGRHAEVGAAGGVGGPAGVAVQGSPAWARRACRSQGGWV